MKSILDPSFKYTSSANTDIRKTFARARREMRKEKEAQEQQAKADADKLMRLMLSYKS